MEYGLIGMPLGHSFSKTIHSRIGDYDYVLRELPPEELEARNADVTAVSDLAPEQPEYERVLTLARAGVISLGEDGSYHPDDEATRVQMASIVDKLVCPEHR